MNILSRKNKWAAINIIGIAIAFASVFFASSYIKHELSFDKFHTKADQVYRLNIDKPGKVGFMQTTDNVNTASLNAHYIKDLYDKFPGIEQIVLMVKPFNYTLKIKDQIYSLENAYYTDHSFFTLFDFKLIQGNKEGLFQQLYEVVISKESALKYFGSTDVIGKELTLKGEFDSNGGTIYTVKGVFDEFPSNSHMKPDVLLSSNLETLRNPYGHAFTYLLLHPDVKPDQLEVSLNKHWKENVAEAEVSPTFKLMNLREIHLKSHKKDELGSNGTIKTIWVIMSGAIIILLIAMINYFNLNTVQLNSDLNNLKIKIINGANLLDLSLSQMKKSSIQISLSIIIGTILTFIFDRFIEFNFMIKNEGVLFIFLVLFFIVLFGAISLLPLQTKKISSNLSNQKEEGSKKFIISLVCQFTLSIVALVLTIVLHQQISKIQNFHPGKDKESIITITEFPYAAISKFDLFKEKALKYPEIQMISSTMMPPGTTPDFVYPFEMEGMDKSENNTISINSIDHEFFKLFDIKALAGDLNLKSGSSYMWESAAISPNEESATKNINNLDPSYRNFKEQYILNESASKKLGFKNPQDAIGKQFKYNFISPTYFKQGEIVAVIKDLHYADMFSEEKAEVIGLKRIFNSTFLVKIDKNNTSKALQNLQETWSQLFPDQPMKYEFLSDSYFKIYRNQYNEMKALTLFAILSILLSILGMYALSSYSIQHKTKEIGIRKANGASSLEIMLQLITEYVVWVAMAFVIASPIAFYAADDWLKSFAYRIDLSWWIFALAGVIAIIIAIITVSWQTYNAARKDPVYALKYE